MKAKINIGADGNYIELAENARYTGTRNEQGKSNKFHSNAKTWDYFVKKIQSDGIYFDVLINVKDTGNNQYVYDITLNEAVSLPNQLRSYTGSSTASNNRISQNQQNATGNIQHSIKTTKDGMKYVEVDTEQELFDGLNESKSRHKAREIILERFARTIIGEKENQPIVATKRTAKEYSWAQKRNTRGEMAIDKMRASTELNNLLEASEFVDHKDYEEVKEKHPEAENGIDHYKTIFKVSDNWYEGIVNILNCRNVRVFYDVTKLKSISGKNGLPANHSSSATGPNASENSISQNQQNATGNIQHSLKAFEKDGRRFVEIDQAQDRFEGRDRSDYPRIAKDIINEKFNGKVIGIDNKMFVNGRGRDEYVNPSRPIKENYVYDAKMRASAELDNLLDAGTNFRNEADGKDGHTHEKVVGGFDYFDTLFKVGDNYFEAVINIENIKNGKLFKDVTKIKDVTEAIMNSYGQSPKFQFLKHIF